MSTYYRYVLICAVLFLSAGCSKREAVKEDKEGSSAEQVEESSPAEKLVGMLPDGVYGFVATSGGEYLRPSFEKSLLGRVWNDPQVQDFYQSAKNEIITKIEQEAGDADEVKLIDKYLGLVRLVLDRPMVLGAAPKEAKEGPPIYGFAVLDAGGRKAEIASAVAELEVLAGPDEIADIKVGSLTMRGPKENDDLPVYWGWVKDYFVIAINDGEGLAAKFLSEARAAAAGYLKDVPGAGDALAVYADYEKIFRMAETLADQEEDLKEFKSTFLAALNELGLDNIKNAVVRLGFAGPGVVKSGFFAAPQPRRGLLSVLRPIEAEVFDMVDAGAVTAVAFNCDFGRVYDTIMGAVKAAAPPDVYAEIEEGIAGFESEAKVSIRAGLLESLAGPIVSYSLPAGVMMDAPSGGFVAIAELKDASEFEKTMAALGQFAGAMSGGMVQASSQVQSDGRTYHSWVIAPLAMMQVMPCWTVVEGQVVIASNPGLCTKAVTQVVSTGSQKQSLRTTEGYKKVTAELPANLIFLSYTDAKVQFSQMMIMLQQYWPMITMFAGQAGVNLPVMLPSLDDVLKDIEPSCEYSWYDSDGFYSHYQGAGLEVSLGAIAGAGIGASVLMPALARTRQLAQRVVSESNLSGIGKACIVYANDDPNGKYPPDLQTLIAMDLISAKQLESKRKPKDFAGPSYIYIAGQNGTMDPGNVIVYENPAFLSDDIAVLFMDTHVETMEPQEFLEALEATYKRLGREMPEIKFKDSRINKPVEVAPITMP